MSKRPYSSADLSDDDVDDMPELDENLGDDGLTEDDILKLVEEAPEVPPLDLPTLRQHVQTLDKAITKNQQLRIKHADEPQKFMDSELKLDEAIKTLTELATQPSLYSDFVEMNGVAMLTGLLSHENNDIAGAAIVLLRDLTESDAFTEHPSAAALLDVLLQPAHLEPIVANLERMDESYPDDAQCVFNTFTIFENICEVRPESVAALTCDFAAAQSAVSDTTSPLFRFLLKRIRYTKHDQNRLYASEILAILLGNEVSDAQSSAGNARAVFAAPPLLGLVQLLAALEAYSGVDIRSAEEEEFVRNLFDALCSALLHTPNRLALVPNMTAEADPEAIALQLMSAMNILTALLRKDLTRPLALRALDFALVRCDANCEAFVEAGGLKTLFAVFMLASKRKLSECQHEEHLMSIVAQLLSLTTEGRFERALGKFTENNNAKVERLVEYRDSYARRLDESDSRQRRAAENDESEQESEDEKYLRHTDCGLYTLQLTDLVLGLISTAGDAALRDRVEELLNQKDYSLDDVKTSLQAFAKHVDDGEQKVLVQKIAALL